MGKETKIRWAGATWNPMVGCTKISPGCDHCYAEVQAERWRGTPGFPDGFAPQFKEHMLRKPAVWAGKPRRIFVNSMSDVHHEAFTDDQIDRVYDAMLATPEHDYLVLTKRPQRMASYLLGHDIALFAHDWAKEHLPARHVAWPKVDTGAYLQRRNLSALPAHIWLGTSIENNRYAFRADWLRACPAPVRFLSCEPLIGPVDLVDLIGISWVIAGGESGNRSNDFRPMDLDWARSLRDRCDLAETAFYFKQSAGFTTETGIELDGRRHEEYPLPHPADQRLVYSLARPDGGIPIGRYVDEVTA